MVSDFGAPAPSAAGATAQGTAYTRFGRGRPVVLIHGVGMNQAVWMPQIKPLARHHEVITYDMLGHGASPLPPEPTTLAAYADQLRDLLDALDLESAVVVGHSMGALVAMDFAVRHAERCRALVAMNAVYCRSAQEREAVLQRAAAVRDVGSAANVAETLKRWFGTPVPAAQQAVAELSQRMLTAVHPVGYARTYGVFAMADAEHAQSLSRLRLPSLFLTGDLDPNSTPAMSRLMAAQVPGAQVVVLDKARHMMSLTDPDRVGEVLSQFLEGLPA